MRPFDVLRMRNTSPPPGPVAALLETSTTPGAVPMPPYVAGDVVFVQIFKADAAGNPGSTTPPAGWTLVGNIDSFSEVISHQIYRRAVDGTEGSTVNFDWVTVGSVNAQAFAISGVSTPGAITESVVTSEGSSPGDAGTITITTSPVTTGGVNRLILNFFGTGRGTDGTLTSGTGVWANLYKNDTSAQGLEPHTAASKRVAATATVYSAETRTETDSVAGIMWNTISFAVIMA